MSICRRLAKIQRLGYQNCFAIASGPLKKPHARCTWEQQSPDCQGCAEVSQDLKTDLHSYMPIAQAGAPSCPVLGLGLLFQHTGRGRLAGPGLAWW